jgi:tetratricopeptide (TPR) repeat protein
MLRRGFITLRMMRHLGATVLLAVACAVLTPAVACAESAEREFNSSSRPILKSGTDAAICEGAAEGDAIAACDRLIAASRDKGSGLAKLYRSRCEARNREHAPEKALADCSEALRLDAGLIAARIGRGDSYRLMRDFERAIAEYGEAIRLDPKSAAALWGRCSSLVGRSEIDRALADCNAAIALSPNYAPAYATRCAILSDKHDFDRALADCDQAVRLDAKYPLAYTARGSLFRNKRDYDRSIAEVSEAIRLDPKLPNAYRIRGLSFRDKRDYVRAIADFGEVIKLDPKYARAYADRCWALHLNKDFDRALKDCDQAIMLDSNLAYFYLRRGLIFVEQRDFDRAIADYTQAIRLDGRYTSAYYDRGIAWWNRRNFDRAIADFSEVIKIDSRNYDGYFRRALALRQKREYDRAIADFDQAISLSPKSVYAFNGRGLVWLDKGDCPRAIADFDEAVRLDPTFPAGFTNRGLAYERNGEPEKARKDFEAALALPENHPSGNGKWAHNTARERLAALQTVARTSEERGDRQASTRNPVRTSIERGPRVALLVGNSSYPMADPPLTQPKNDTRALADELKRMGFAVEVAENVTKAGLQRAIDNFKKKIKPESIALLYFSGFGVQTNRQTYLLPTDSQIWNETDIRRDGTNLESIMEEISGQGAAVKLAIIDASRRNPYERHFRPSAAGLAAINVPKDSLVIYSVGLGQALNDTAGEQSLFMSELLKELRSPGVSAEEVFARTRIGVSRASDVDQVPWVASSLVESFYFVPSGRSSADRLGPR